MDTSSAAPGGFPRPAAYSSGSVEADGRRLHYLDYGTAGKPAMLCVHGGAAHGHWFDYVAPGFLKDYHVRAIDLRGHGDSPWAVPPDYSYERHAADLAEVAERLDLRDFVLMGHSMGGAVSLLYAATHPGRVGKLVIIDTTMNLPPERIESMRQVGNRKGNTYASVEEFVSRFRLRPGTTQAPPEVVRYIAERGCRQAPDGSWMHKFDRDVYATRVAMDGFPYWDRIKIPALLVKGGLSERITPEVLAKVRARAPQVAFAEVPGADHHVTLDNPAGCIAAVTAFLAANGQRSRTPGA